MHPSKESDATGILFGKVIETREEQPAKALAFIDVFPDITIDVSMVWLRNASVSIEVTLYVAETYQKLSGMTIEFLLAPEALSPLTAAV
ncbi:MAG: hypothetical protein WC083_02555 [Candidatus Methanomethylophilaceae archaeon]